MIIFQYLKAFPLKLVILTNVIFILHNEICTHLEELHNTVNQYFPNKQFMMLQNYALRKYSLKLQDRPTDFNVTVVQ
jgi:hypothetical protein